MITPPGFNNGLDIMRVSGRVMSGPRKAFPSTNAKLNGATRELVTVSFTKSEPWVCPMTTTQVESLRGYGSPGNPEFSGYVPYYTGYAINTQYYYDGTTRELDAGNFSGYGSPPANYCGTYIPPAPPSYPDYPNGRTGTQTCYYYQDATYEVYEPPTYGQDATAFGFTFTRGYGGNSYWTNIDAVPFSVNPGETYNIVVPSGGYVTFSYYV